jgi:hypothetical protein
MSPVRLKTDVDRPGEARHVRRLRGFVAALLVTGCATPPPAPAPLPAAPVRVAVAPPRVAPATLDPSGDWELRWDRT